MSPRSNHLLLNDIIEAITKIERYIEGLDYGAFASDDKTVDAVVRNLEIIGEAANRLPDSFTAQHRKIPWRRIVGLRNRIVHDYFGLDLKIVWEILGKELPVLKKQLEQLRDS